MNRQQRRALKKQRSEETFWRDKYEDQFNAKSQIEMEIFYTCFSLGMHRLYGFGAERILRVLKFVDEQYAKLNSGEATMESLAEELKRECGVELQIE